MATKLITGGRFSHAVLSEIGESRNYNSDVVVSNMGRGGGRSLWNNTLFERILPVAVEGILRVARNVVQTSRPGEILKPFSWNMAQEFDGTDEQSYDNLVPDHARSYFVEHKGDIHNNKGERALTVGVTPPQESADYVYMLPESFSKLVCWRVGGAKDVTLGRSELSSSECQSILASEDPINGSIEDEEEQSRPGQDDVPNSEQHLRVASGTDLQECDSQEIRNIENVDIVMSKRRTSRKQLLSGSSQYSPNVKVSAAVRRSARNKRKKLDNDLAPGAFCSSSEATSTPPRKKQITKTGSSKSVLASKAINSPPSPLCTTSLLLPWTKEASVSCLLPEQTSRQDIRCSLDEGREVVCRRTLMAEAESSSVVTFHGKRIRQGLRRVLVREVIRGNTPTACLDEYPDPCDDEVVASIVGSFLGASAKIMLWPAADLQVIE